MIITLRGADFSASNIGTLSSWRITRSLGTGATYDGATSVDKGASFSATVTIAEGYELGAAGVTVTMGGNVISAATVNGNVIAIAIAEVTGNVVIKVHTVNINTGEEDEPDTPDTPQPITTLLTSVATETMRNTGLKPASYETYSDDSSIGRTTFTEIPVEPNAFYYINHAIRIWYLDASKQPITTVNPSKYTPAFYIKTPSNACYMSITFRETLSSGETILTNDATMVRYFDYHTTGTTVTIAQVAGSVELNKALSSGAYKLTDKDTNTTFMEVPVYGETTYYIENGLRLWYLTEDKSSISTINIATETDAQYQFTTPLNVAYISISVRNATTDGAPLDYNTMTMVVR